MGDPRRLKKKYEPPSHPWEKERILEEKKLMKEYGLKNKKEIWRAKTQIRKYRHMARELVGLAPEEREEKEKALLNKLERYGILPENSSLDDVLSLKTEDLLKRRLQTIVWKKGLARTIKQARQFITHGHIAVNGIKTTAPSMIIDLETEKTVGWYKEPLKIAIEEPKQETGLEVIAKEVEKEEEKEIMEKEQELAEKEEEELKEAAENLGE